MPALGRPTVKHRLPDEDRISAGAASRYPAGATSGAGAGVAAGGLGTACPAAGPGRNAGPNPGLSRLDSESWIILSLVSYHS